MAVGNLSSTDQNTHSILTAAFQSPSTDITKLGETQNGKFMLDHQKFVEFFQNRGYTEFRVYCHKPGHGRTFHAVLNGEFITRRFINRVLHLKNLCGSIRFLSDDNSILANEDCQDYESYGHYFDHTLWISYQYHVFIALHSVISQENMVLIRYP